MKTVKELFKNASMQEQERIAAHASPLSPADRDRLYSRLRTKMNGNSRSSIMHHKMTALAAGIALCLAVGAVIVVYRHPVRSQPEVGTEITATMPIYNQAAPQETSETEETTEPSVSSVD